MKTLKKLGILMTFTVGLYVSINCLSEPVGNLLIRSLPMECELSFNGELSKDKINIKGGNFIKYPSDKWAIKKVENILYINGIPQGKYEIIFKKADKEIIAKADIQEGKTCLLNCNFPINAVFNIEQVYVGKDGYPMVKIPAGEFLMGSDKGEPDEQPVHKVYLDAFYIDIYEVTNAQYKKFLDATKHKPPRYWNDSRYNVPDQPVVGVTWQDAMDYCKWAEKRLPTEAEWEKASRGGLIGKEYPWGDEEILEAPMTDENPGLASAFPVGSFKPNGYGLFDVERNAWEWCLDWYDEEYYAKSPEKNPKGPVSGDKRVLRGGSWFSGIYTPLRIPYRYSLEPDQATNLIGFRCVQDSK
ncbi:MAG: formylglycine-generating enzyme family protein [Candidatus Poribacteria bacterium]